MTDLLDPKTLLAAYDSQLRARDDSALPPGASVDQDGPARRVFGLYNGGFLDYHDLGGLAGAELDAFIARQVSFFAQRGEKFEWKTRGHDLPADLPQRLLAAGFVPEEQETVLIGLAAGRTPEPSGDVVARETLDPADFDRIVTMQNSVWGGDQSWIGQMLRVEADGEIMRVFVAEADGLVVSAAWIRFVPGTDFAGLWGGSTLEQYRGRGIYRALVAVRAELAVAKGYKYLQVDASDDSRPILQRLGFVAVTTTTPYIWTPPTAT